MSKSEKKRGKFLTISLIVALIIHIFAFFLYGFTNYAAATKLHSTYPHWYQVELFIVHLIGASMTIGVWYWKKWAVFVSIALEVFQLSLVFLYIRHNYATSQNNLQLELIFVLIIIFLLYYPIYKKWEYFS